MAHLPEATLPEVQSAITELRMLEREFGQPDISVQNSGVVLSAGSQVPLVRIDSSFEKSDYIRVSDSQAVYRCGSRDLGAVSVRLMTIKPEDLELLIHTPGINWDLTKQVLNEIETARAHYCTYFNHVAQENEKAEERECIRESGDAELEDVWMNRGYLCLDYGRSVLSLPFSKNNTNFLYCNIDSCVTLEFELGSLEKFKNFGIKTVKCANYNENLDLLHEASASLQNNLPAILACIRHYRSKGVGHEEIGSRVNKSITESSLERDLYFATEIQGTYKPERRAVIPDWLFGPA